MKKTIEFEADDFDKYHGMFPFSVVRKTGDVMTELVSGFMVRGVSLNDCFYNALNCFCNHPKTQCHPDRIIEIILHKP